MQDNLKKNTISGTVWKFAERFASQGVSMLVSIILARILTPDDYGLISIVTIFFTFANVLITGGLNTALIQKKDADKYDYSIVLFFTLIISVVIYVILFFTAPFISNIYNQPELTEIFRIMGLILPIMSVKSVVCAYVSASLKFKKFFLSTITGIIVSAIVGIIMALNGFGVWALVAQQMINPIIDTLILLIVSGMKLSPKLKFDRSKKLFGYGSKVLLSSVIDTAFLELNPIFIGIKYTPADLSYYTKGKSFPSTISNSITSTLSAVFFPVLSKVQSEKERVLRYLRLFMRVSSFIIFPMMLGFLAVSDNFVTVILTDKWKDASIYIKIFCLVSMFDMIASGNCQVIKAIGRADIFLKIEIIKKACYFLIIGAFIFLTNSPVMLALSMILCTLVSLIVNTYPNTKLIGYSYKEQLGDILPNLILSAIMSLCVFLVGKINIPPLPLLIIQILAGILMYVLLAVLTKNSSFKYILKTVRELKRK